MIEDLQDEIRRLKSLLVKHEKRIRVLEARFAETGEAPPSSANTSLVESPEKLPQTAPVTTENHVTHDTNANVAKSTDQDMAPDEV